MYDNQIYSGELIFMKFGTNIEPITENVIGYIRFPIDATFLLYDYFSKTLTSGLYYPKILYRRGEAHEEMSSYSYFIYP